ncbi:hypothetical protein BC567DRAFT_236940 [Phyllosticta citribraziliensis]
MGERLRRNKSLLAAAQNGVFGPIQSNAKPSNQERPEPEPAIPPHERTRQGIKHESLIHSGVLFCLVPLGYVIAVMGRLVANTLDARTSLFTCLFLPPFPCQLGPDRHPHG